MLKKLWIFVAIVALLFVLGACTPATTDPDDNGDDPINGDDPTLPSEAELLAQAFIDNWTGDLTYLSNMIDSMMGADSYEITTELYVETYSEFWGEEVTHIVSTDKVVILADSRLLHRQQVMDVDGMQIETNVIVVEQDNGVSIYFDAAEFLDAMDPEIYDELSSVFAIESDWVRLDLDDSLANMIEFEILNQFIQARLLEAFLGDVATLDDIEDQLLELLGIEKEAANLRLQVLFETLFEFDLNLVVAHLLDIDAELVVEGFLDNVVAEEILYDLYDEETWLRDNGFDFDTYVPILEEEGFRAALAALTEEQANILGDYFHAPIFAIKQAFEADDVLHALIMTFLDEAEMDLRDLEGFDYDLVYDVMSTLDLEALHAELETYDFNAHFESLALGYYLEYYEELPESELKTFFGLLNDLVIPNMGEAAVVFEFNTLIEDLVRFDPYMDLNYFGSHEEVELTMDMTEEYHILTAMHMSPAMLEAFATEFLDDVWHWLNQLQALNIPEFGDEVSEIFELLDTTLIVHMLHDPADMSALSVHVDLLDLFVELSGDDELRAFELSVSIQEGAEITVPTDAFYLNDLFEDLSKLFMASDIDHFLVGIEYYEELEVGIYPLSDFRNADHYAGVFDLELSTVEVLEDGNIIAIFYYIDGSPVFDSVYDLHEVRELTEQDFTREAFLSITALFDADTYHITRFLVLILSDIDWNIGDDYDPFTYWLGYFPPHLWWWEDVSHVAWEEQVWYLYVYDRECSECSQLRWLMIDFWLYSDELVYFIDLDDVMGMPTVPVTTVPALYIMQGDQVIDILHGPWAIDEHVWPLIDYGHGQDDFWYDYDILELYYWEDVTWVAPEDETWFLFAYDENDWGSEALRWDIIDLHEMTDYLVYVIDVNEAYGEPTLPLEWLPTLYVMHGEELVEVIDSYFDIQDYIDALIWD